MGLEYLDLSLRIERQFRVHMKQRDWESLVRAGPRPDVRACDILDFIVAHPACRLCGYSLRGYGSRGVCPECSRPFSLDEAETWRTLRALLAEVVGAQKVDRGTLLGRDLGYT